MPADLSVPGGFSEIAGGNLDCHHAGNIFCIVLEDVSAGNLTEINATKLGNDV